MVPLSVPERIFNAKQLQLIRPSGTAAGDLLPPRSTCCPPRRRAEIVAVDWDSLAPEEAKRLRALGIEEGACVAGRPPRDFRRARSDRTRDRPHDRGDPS
jgi:hypothetical protein